MRSEMYERVPAGKIVKIIHYVRDGKAGGQSMYEDLKEIPEFQKTEHTYGIAQTDLSPGDIVEIVGDYAVKVSTAGASILPSPWSLSLQEVPLSSSQSVQAPPARKEENCRCPFGPNLGPIQHTRTCVNYKGEVY